MADREASEGEGGADRRRFKPHTLDTLAPDFVRFEGIFVRYLKTNGNSDMASDRHVQSDSFCQTSIFPFPSEGIPRN